MLKKITTYALIILITMTLAIRCATIGYPTGGPKDSLPPTLIGTYPRPYATNFDGKKVVLMFNEYVQLKDQSKLFFMSPPAAKKPIITIRGKAITVEFQEKLDSNATYRLDFGNAIRDNNEGNKLENFSFVFATGQFIDSLIMGGQTIDAYTRDTIIGALISFFDQTKTIRNNNLDSTIFNARADALFRTDSSGYFVADILKDKQYRIYAMADDNADQAYQAGTDMIGFFNDTFNPVQMPQFSMTYDSISGQWKLTPPQLIFEMFKELPAKRQTLLDHKRIEKLKLSIVFNATQTIIDTLDFDDVPQSWIIKQWNNARDSLSIWIAPPTKQDLENLPDTLKARLAFQKHDSVWNLYTHAQNLSFNFKSDKPKTKTTNVSSSLTSQKKTKKPKKISPKRAEALARKEHKDSLERVEKARKDSAEMAKAAVNPFKVAVNAQKEFIPLGDIVFDFSLPLTTVETKRITLTRTPAQTEKKGAAARNQHLINEKPIPEPFEFRQDSTTHTRWRLVANWRAGDSYELLIPDSTFRDIAFAANDTLKAEFTAMLPDKYGTAILNFKPDSTYNGQYILELIEGRGKSEKITRRLILPPDKINESTRIEYIKPGSYRLRIIEDRNGNFRWDTGIVTRGIQPEKSRLWRTDAGDTEIVSKENWELKIDINLFQIFNNP